MDLLILLRIKAAIIINGIINISSFINPEAIINKIIVNEIKNSVMKFIIGLIMFAA